MSKLDQNYQHIVRSAAIVQAYVTHNSLPAREIFGLLRKVHSTLVSLSTQKAPGRRVDERKMPDQKAIGASIRHDGIVSFIDGKAYKSLKRHLTAHGFDPIGYREFYGLPANYPMVAPAYSEMRARIAKDISLGVIARGSAERIAPTIKNAHRQRARPVEARDAG